MAASPGRDGVHGVCPAPHRTYWGASQGIT
jgi:hypothetical protein